MGKSSNAELVAAILAGAWRSVPPAPTFSAKELERVAPLLLGSGAGPLAWRRVRNSSLRDAPASAALRQAQRFQSLQAALHRRNIKRVFRRLGAAGVEPLLIKGWACSRYYPEAGLRPYGDIDLIVRPCHLLRAEATLKELPDLDGWVDLRHRLGPRGDLDVEAVFAGSEVVLLDGVKVRLAGAEDHLRLLCLHLLKHGAWRPLWLCDVAAAIEARRRDFDWARCLGESRKVAERIACVIGLAHQLLGAKVDDTPLAGKVGKLPRWLVRAVLKQWERPYATEHESPELMSHALRRPARVLKALRRRWPDPVTATVSLDGEFDDKPRLPFQLAEYVSQSARFVARLAMLQVLSGRDAGNRI